MLNKNNKTIYFVTLFYIGLKNYHISKDVGQIPYHFSKKGNYKSSIVTPNSSDNFNNIEQEAPGIEIINLNKGIKFGYYHLSIIKYLIYNSKKIDILNLYHFSPPSLVYGIIYKLIHPSGKIYLKMDYDLKVFIKNGNKLFNFGNKFINYLLKPFENLLIRISTVISVETDNLKLLLEKYNSMFINKLIYLPNGVDFKKITNDFGLINAFEEKENIILSVGRFGTQQKNTELLLEILAIINLKDWKVFLIGNIEIGFEGYINNYFINNPHLKNNIIFLGPIYNRNKLYEYYNKSKIFLLTSRWEGFPIVFSESIFFGNYIISTNLDAANDITNYGELGFVANNTKLEISKHLQNIIDGKIDISNFYKKIIANSKNKYNRKLIINKLIKSL